MSENKEKKTPEILTGLLGDEEVEAVELSPSALPVAEELDRRVNKHRKKGWEPQGGVSVAPWGNSDTYAQAIVRATGPKICPEME